MKKRLSMTISAILCSTTFAQTATSPLDTKIKISTHRKHEKSLDTVNVTASPLYDPEDNLVKPTKVLSGGTLEDRASSSLGETTAQEAGVQSSYFGPGVGRPIIRGMEGARVQVLANGLAVQDASTVSADHAVSIEPFLADQIEILKGPSVLLFGSGAIGGVVNSVDGRIHENPVDGWSGRAQIRANSVNDEKTGMFRVDGGNSIWTMHVDYLNRDTHDYQAGDGNSLENSAIQTETSSLGLSYTPQWGFVGLSVNQFDSLYGIPHGAHGSHDEIIKSIEEADEDEETVQIDLQQRRLDAKAGILNPFNGWSKLQFAYAKTDYEHREIADGAVGTVFQNDADEFRIEALHNAFSFGLEGLLGGQWTQRDFTAIGEEAFVPATTTETQSLFFIEKWQHDPYQVEFGLRADKQRIDGNEIPFVEHYTWSLSTGGTWNFSEQLYASLNFDQAQRAPMAEELFSDGSHEATAAYEIGDPQLRPETAQQIELGLHYHIEGIQFNVSVYHNAFEDFIYLQETGEMIDNLPVRAWTQQDATFSGIETEFEAKLADTDFGRFDLRVFADTVSGTRDNSGEPLPRIAPARIGANLSWQHDAWRARLGAIRYASQDKVALNETPTAGFTLVNAHLSYAFTMNNRLEWEIFADGTNLTDKVACAHTSLLKERAPLPGRGIATGVRIYF